jgi:hypothetical protein
VEDATSVLFDLPGFAVIEYVELDDERCQAVIIQVADSAEARAARCR